MLFDLQSRGRRNFVKVIYLGLAILMGGGLVLFGIGTGTGGGGLLDVFNGGGSSTSAQVSSPEKKAAERSDCNPQDPQAWADLARARYQTAGLGENYDQTANRGGEFTDRAERSSRGRDRLAEIPGARAGAPGRDARAADGEGVLRNRPQRAGAGGGGDGDRHGGAADGLGVRGARAVRLPRRSDAQGRPRRREGGPAGAGRPAQTRESAAGRHQETGDRGSCAETAPAGRSGASAPRPAAGSRASADGRRTRPGRAPAGACRSAITGYHSWSVRPRPTIPRAVSSTGRAGDS